MHCSHKKDDMLWFSISWSSALTQWFAIGQQRKVRFQKKKRRMAQRISLQVMVRKGSEQRACCFVGAFLLDYSSYLFCIIAYKLHNI